MSSKLAPRLPTTPAPPQSSAVASARRNAATPRGGRDRNENNAGEREKDRARRAESAGGRSTSKQPPTAASSSFPAVEYLLQSVEDAVYGGVFQGAVTEHRLLELVSAAKRELRATTHRVLQLEAQNSELESECRRYRQSVSKIQTQSETLRRSSRGKDALCDAQLHKLVVMLREVHGYEDEPALSEDEQQEQQLALSDVSSDEDEEGEEDNEEDARDARSSSSASSDGEGARTGRDGGDDTQLDCSNQTEEEQAGDESAGESPPSDDELAASTSSVVPLAASAAAGLSASLPGAVDAKDGVKGAAPRGGRPAHSLLPLTVAQPVRKSIKEPKPPRGGGVGRASAARGSRLQFQFRDAELGGSGFGDFSDDEDDDGAEALEGKRTGVGVAWADPAAPSPAHLQRRRFSSSAAIAAAVPLRRKSFTMKRSPAKRIAVTTAESEASPPPPASSAAANGSGRWAARRKSTSACLPARRGSVGGANARSPSKWKAAEAAAAAAVASPRSSQMVVRVRERKGDGVPELVIRKKPARFVVWQWAERQVRMPFVIQLGPQQHGVMLRQLRYVKSVMHELPWAKAQLKELLAAYTKKDLSKEQLYPQLNHLSHHVQGELGARAQRQRQLAHRKQRLTLQLSLAAGAVNDLPMLKFGRRGKPHETKLRYDPGDPTRLHWLRKSGERSDECLAVDLIDVRAQLDGAVLRRAARKYPLDPDACVSLVTPARSLDLQLRSPLQRDWLLNALRDIIAFAKQYKAAGAAARRQQLGAKDQRQLLLARR